MSVEHFLAADNINFTPVSAATPLPIGGAADNGATVTSGVLTGGRMDSTVGGPTIGTTGRFGALSLDLARRQIVKQLGSNQSHITANVASNGLTNVTLIAAAANLKADLQSLTVANRDTVAHTLDLLDVAAIIETIVVPPGSTWQLTWPAGRPNAAVNTAWNIVLREVHTTSPVVVSASGYRTTS